MKFNDLINLSPYKYFGLIEIGHWRGGGRPTSGCNFKLKFTFILIKIICSGNKVLLVISS